VSSLRIPRPSPATAIALVALFVSLGGTTYAVTALPRNSVGTEQIRNRSVTEKDLAGGSVITSKLADLSVTRRKLGLGAVTADRVAADALTGGQIDESTFSAVPLARDAERAGVAQRAAVADLVERATRADRATTAGSADRATVAEQLARVVTTVEPFIVPDGFFLRDTIACEEGFVAVGGGFILTGAGLPVISESGPAGTGWTLHVEDLIADGDDVPGNAYAVCVAAAGP
jgi:hypothetical protein